MSIGSQYKITNINYDNKFSKTLIDMGFTKDKCFKVIGTDPLNGLYVLHLGSYKLAVRKNDLKNSLEIKKEIN